MPDTLPLVRFFRGQKTIGSAHAKPDSTLVEIAHLAGITIPTNCTSGNCGTCLVRLIDGDVEMPDPIPPGLDEHLIEEGGILTCCINPSSDCDIDVIPPL